HVAMAESGPCDQGILFMELVAVIGIDHCGDAPLRVGRRAGLQMSLAQQGNAAVVCQLERQGHAGGAAADDQHVVMEASVVHGEEGGRSLTRDSIGAADGLGYGPWTARSRVFESGCLLESGAICEGPERVGTGQQTRSTGTARRQARVRPAGAEIPASGA